MSRRQNVHINEHDNIIFNITQISCIKTDLKSKIKTMRIFYRNSTHKDIKNNSIEYSLICNEINTLYALYKSFEHEIYNMSVYENVNHYSGCETLLEEYTNRKELLYWLKTNIENTI